MSSSKHKHKVSHENLKRKVNEYHSSNLKRLKKEEDEIREDVVARILIMLTDPEECVPVRFADGNAVGVPTAIKKLKTALKVQWNNQASAPVPSPVGNSTTDQLLFFFPNLFRNVAYTLQNNNPANATFYVYRATFYDMGNQSSVNQTFMDCTSNFQRIPANGPHQTLTPVYSTQADGPYIQLLTTAADPGPGAGMVKPTTGTATVWGPHGKYLYHGSHEKRKGFWLDQDLYPNVNAGSGGQSGNSFILQFNGPGDGGTIGTDSVFVTVWYLNGGSWELDTATTLAFTTAPSSTHPIFMQILAQHRSGYYSVEVAYALSGTPAANHVLGIVHTHPGKGPYSKNVHVFQNTARGNVHYKTYDQLGDQEKVKLPQAAGTAQSLLVGISTWSRNQTVMATLPVVDVTPPLLVSRQITAYRMPALSEWLKNNASPLNQQGFDVAFQAQEGEDFVNSYLYSPITYTAAPGTSGMLNKIFTKTNGQDFSLADGEYSFRQLAGATDLNWKKEVELGSSDITPASIDFALIPDSSYLMLGASTVSTSGGDCNMKIWNVVEYQTTASWEETHLPEATPAEFQMAFAISATIPQHLENPSHELSIFSHIYAAIGNYAPLAAEMAAMIPGIGGSAAALINGIGGIARYLTPDELKERASKNRMLTDEARQKDEQVMKEGGGGGHRHRKRKID